MRCIDQYDKKIHHVTYQWYRWYQWYHWQQKSVQGFLVTIGKNGTNSTIGRSADFTVGRTPNVANITGHDLAKDLHHKGFYTNANRAVQAQTMTGGCKF